MKNEVLIHSNIIIKIGLKANKSVNSWKSPFVQQKMWIWKQMSLKNKTTINFDIKNEEKVKAHCTQWECNWIRWKYYKHFEDKSIENN